MPIYGGSTVSLLIVNIHATEILKYILEEVQTELCKSDPEQILSSI